MTIVALQDLIQKNAQIDLHLKLSRSGYVFSPFVSKFLPINKHEFNTAYYHHYTSVHDVHIHHTVVLRFLDGQYYISCGDPFMEGSVSKDGAQKLSMQALQKKNLNPKHRLGTLMQEGYNIMPKSTECNYNFRTQKDELNYVCSHVAQFLHDLPKEVYLKLHQNHVQWNTNVINVLSLEEKFERYAFKKHVLLEGDKGSGKTYAAMQWGSGKDVEQIFIGGHEQFESIDFLGHYIQQKSGALVWKDGPLSQAFRKANSGKKVLLIIDELLRIPKRELNILVSALSAVNGIYTLRTGRALDESDGIAVEEVIKANAANLWVIGTTNVGEDYAVESIDEALLDRFKPLRKDTNEEEIHYILSKKAEAKQYSQKCVNDLMGFYKHMQRLYTTQSITKSVNLRHLSEAIEISNYEEEVSEILLDSILLWVDREFNGRPNETQIFAVKTVLEKIYDFS